jgi:hypothetical protein
MQNATSASARSKTRTNSSKSLYVADMRTAWQALQEEQSPAGEGIGLQVFAGWCLPVRPAS